jgi:hypothetical protein
MNRFTLNLSGAKIKLQERNAIRKKRLLFPGIFGT